MSTINFNKDPNELFNLLDRGIDLFTTEIDALPTWGRDTQMTLELLKGQISKSYGECLNCDMPMNFANKIAALGEAFVVVHAKIKQLKQKQITEEPPRLRTIQPFWVELLDNYNNYVIAPFNLGPPAEKFVVDPKAEREAHISPFPASFKRDDDEKLQ